MVDLRDNENGLAALNIFKRGLRTTYKSHLRRKDHAHFGTSKGVKGPLETIFKKLDFKPLVFETFKEISEGGKEVLEIELD